MPRPEKVQAVADIKERIERARAVFLTEYAGLSVKDQQTLRRELRANGSEFKVVKMTLARLAAEELDSDEFNELLIGPTGLTFSDEDAVTTARTLKGFAKDHDVFVIKGGLLGREFLSPETIAQLAEIEPREVLLAKFAGAMKAPMANLAALVAALPRNAASMFQQLLEKKETVAPEAVVVDTPEAETPEPEATTEDTAPDENAPAEGAADEGVEAAADAEDAAEEAEEAPEVAEEAEVPEASVDDDSAQTEDDDSAAKVEASNDAEDKTDDETEASNDAEEE